MDAFELQELCTINVVTSRLLANCEPFSCGNDDLDDFFLNDSLTYQKQLLGKTYLFCLKSNPKIIVTALTLSNDSIRITQKLNELSKEQFLESTNLTEKNLRRYPATLIGRLGTNKKFAGRGFGTGVMEFVKSWFRINNKTGCRFLIVDAYNNPETLHYYEKNGFRYLIDEERLEAKYMGIGMGHLPLNTRLMYFDLLTMSVEDER